VLDIMCLKPFLRIGFIRMQMAQSLAVLSPCLSVGLKLTTDGQLGMPQAITRDTENILQIKERLDWCWVLRY